MTQQRPRQLHAGDAVDDLGLDRHQMRGIDLVRHLEQRTVMVPPLAFGMMQRPGGIFGEGRDRGRRRLDLEFGADEFAYRESEGQLPGLQIGRRVERQADVCGHRRAVERRRRLRLDGARRIALHEQTLAVVERRQPAVAAAKLRHRGRHAEQGADEILKRPRQFDQQVRLVLGGQLLGRRARRHQPCMKAGIDLLQPGDEGGIETAETVAVVEVVEAEPMGKRGSQPGRVHCEISRRNEGYIVRTRTA